MSRNSYLLDADENKIFLQKQVRSLLDFGRQFPSPAGSAYWLNGDGTPDREHNRETWITCRMVHVYSIGTLLRVPGCQQLAEAGLSGLTGELHDAVHGGWYEGVHADGTPYGNKTCYTHAFVILAASSALQAGIAGAAELLAEALTVYRDHFWDEAHAMPYDTWDMNFTQLDPYRGINASMHSVEAFLATADATGMEIYRRRAGKIIYTVLDLAFQNGWRLPEHFNENWEPQLDYNMEKADDPFKPYGATPGHGIEWARLALQYDLSAHLEGSSELIVSKAAEQMYSRAVADGWNAGGEPGFAYTTNWQGTPVVLDRMHWTLAEAINTSAVLFRVTGQQKYADDYSRYMQYLDETVLDHTHGSWYHQLDAHNRLKETVWPGKCDLYHAFQCMLIPYSDPAVSICTAVKNKMAE